MILGVTQRTSGKLQPTKLQNDIQEERLLREKVPFLCKSIEILSNSQISRTKRKKIPFQTQTRLYTKALEINKPFQSWLKEKPKSKKETEQWSVISSEQSFHFFVKSKELFHCFLNCSSKIINTHRN